MKSRGRARYLAITLVIKAVQGEIDLQTRVIPEHIKDKSHPRIRVQQADTMDMSHPITGISILSVAIPATVSMLTGPTQSIANIIQHPTGG